MRFERLAALLLDAKKLQTARADAMALFARNNNWDKNPAPKAGEGAKPAGGAGK